MRFLWLLRAGLLPRAAGFLAGYLLRVLTRRWVVPLGVPSPEARLARVATMVVAALAWLGCFAVFAAFDVWLHSKT